MRKHARIALIIAAALTAVLVVACGDDDESGNGGDGGSPAASAGSSPDPSGSPGSSPDLPDECEDTEKGLITELDFEDNGSFTTSGQVPAGEDLNARMRMINCSASVTTLYFGTTQRYEMTVVTDDEEEVWRWSDGEEFDNTPGTEVLGAGDIITYEESWDQMNEDGEQVEPGLYHLSFLSVGCGREGIENCRFGPVKPIEITE
jgi:hypothetical protein